MGKRKSGKKPVARRTIRTTKKPTKKTTKKSTARSAKKKATARRVEPLIVRANGEPLGRDLRAGKRARTMHARRKASLLKKAAPQRIDTGLWSYAYLTARRPWIDNVARLAVVVASMRSNPNDFMLTASDGGYHRPFAGVYFRAPKANVPILIDFIVNALKQQVVTLQVGGKLQETTLAAGSHHVSTILVPQAANLYSAQLRTQRGNPADPLLELEAVELTTLE